MAAGYQPPPGALALDRAMTSPPPITPPTQAPQRSIVFVNIPGSNTPVRQYNVLPPEIDPKSPLSTTPVPLQSNVLRAHLRAGLAAGTITPEQATAAWNHDIMQQAIGNTQGFGGFLQHAGQDLGNVVTGLGVAGVQAGKSLVQDVGAVAHGQLPTHTAGFLGQMGKGTYEQAKGIVQHPLGTLENQPASTALLAWGGASALRGGIARAGAVKQAATGDAAKSLADAVGGLTRQDARAYSALVQHVAGQTPETVHPTVAARIAQPSKALSRVISLDPALAQARSDVIGHLGNGTIQQTGSALAGAAREAAASKTAQIAKAVVRTPKPGERTLTVPTENGPVTVTRLPSKNALARDIQNIRDARLQAKLNREPGGGQPILQLPGSLIGHNMFSPQAVVGRELKTAREIENSLATAPAASLGRYGRTIPAKLIGATTRGRVEPSALLTGRGNRLSPAEQKALDIVASGVHDNPVEAANIHLAGHQNGALPTNVKQAVLARAAAQHLENPSPLLQKAIEDTRAVSNKTAEAKGMTPEEQAYRLGARATELQSMAKGEVSPVQQLTQLEDELALAMKAAKARIQAEDPSIHPLALHGKALDEVAATAEDVARQEKIAALRDQILAEGQRAVARGGFYFPSKAGRSLKSPGPLGGKIINPDTGIATSNPKFWTQHYEGVLDRTGRARSDVTNLVREDSTRAQRWAGIQKELDTALKLSVPYERVGELRDPVALRPSPIPDALKAAMTKVESGHVNARDVKTIHDGWDQYLAAVTPEVSTLTAEEAKNLTYIDRPYLKGLMARQQVYAGPWRKVWNTLNNPIRAMAFYLAPKYALNALQSYITISLEQGVFVPPNLARLVKLTPETQDLVYAAVKEGLSRSLEPHSGTGYVTRGLQGLGEAWSKVTDKVQRGTALIHEARREGFHTEEQIRQLLTSADPSMVAKRNVVVRRANRESIAYGELANWERAFRDALFVYPWLRASFLWGVRFPVEHPIQAALLGQVGEQGHKLQEQQFPGGLPPQFESIAKVGGGYSVDPSSINNFSTLQTAEEIARGLSQPRSQFAGALASEAGPLASALAMGVFGTNGSQSIRAGQTHIGAALGELGSTLPPVSFITRATKPDTSNLPAGKQGVNPGGIVNAAKQFGAGGMAPLNRNEQALAAKAEASYVSTLNPVDKAQHKGDKTLRQARQDAQVYGLSLQPIVEQAIQLRTARDVAIARLGRNPTPQAKAIATIEAAAASGTIPADGATKWIALIGRQTNKAEITKLTASFWRIYGRADALTAWNSDVKAFKNRAAAISNARLAGAQRAAPVGR